MGRFSTDPDCVKQREYLNIPAWHDAGYLGQGLTIFCDDNSPEHREIVADMIQTILPEAKVLTGTISNTIERGKVTDCRVFCYETGETLPFDDFIKKHNISLINNSTTGGKGTIILPEAVYMQEKIVEHDLIFCGAAGNGYMQPTTQQYNGACIVVASAVLKNRVIRPGNCSVGENIDFAMFQGFAVGTSFASPFLLGMAGLMRCKYSGITQDKVYQYFKDHCQRDPPEKNIRGGWGVPIMGDPYEEMEGEEVTVTETKIKVDGQIKTVRRILYKGENYIRLRDFEDVLGVVDVDYDAENKMPVVAD